MDRKSSKKSKNMTKFSISKPQFSPSMREEFVTPFSQLFDSILEQTFPEFKTESGISHVSGSFPKVDVIDKSECVCIIAEIPGWEKENLTIKCENNILNISGRSRNESSEDVTDKYLIKELKRSHFNRSFQLTEKLDNDNIEAEFNNGLLTINIPKKIFENNSKLIEIK